MAGTPAALGTEERARSLVPGSQDPALKDHSSLLARHGETLGEAALGASLVAHLHLAHGSHPKQFGLGKTLTRRPRRSQRFVEGSEGGIRIRRSIGLQ